MYLHVPMVTFVMNPNTSASCIRFLYERSNTYFQLSRSTLLRQTRHHNTHENKTLLVLSCVLPSSQKTAGYVSRTKKKGKSGEEETRDKALQKSRQGICTPACRCFWIRVEIFNPSLFKRGGIFLILQERRTSY